MMLLLHISSTLPDSPENNAALYNLWSYLSQNWLVLSKNLSEKTFENLVQVIWMKSLSALHELIVGEVIKVKKSFPTTS